MVGQGRPFVDVSVASGGVSLLGLGATAADVAAVAGQGRPFVDVSVASGGVSLLWLGATAADVASVVGHENFLYYIWLTINKDTCSPYLSGATKI